MKTIKVGIMGMGTVGTGVMKIIEAQREYIYNKIGVNLEIKKVLVRDVTKERNIPVHPEVLTDNYEDITKDPEIKICIEVMGGVDTTKDMLLDAIENGKSIVTANKDLMAISGKEIFEKAYQAGVDVKFEASVAGGIPIIRPLKDCLAANRVSEIMGIINGTTNYILTNMTEKGSNFQDVLREAQDLGYAEADPTADIEGFDAARKIAILASIGFNTRVTLNDVHVEGITKITSQDIAYAKELGFVIKLLGIAKAEPGEVEARVHPVFIPKNHPLAAVNDAFNAIYVKGDAVGETMFYGPGAGEMPTASAIMGDVVEVAQNIKTETAGKRYNCTCFEKRRIKTIGEMEAQYYIRLTVKDQPGVLASIASVFGNQGVSIGSVVQKRRGEEMAEIVLITHGIKEQNVQDALQIIQGLSTVEVVSNVIRVEGGNN
ncbi:homoserine dehydrogenase [Desulfitispora alkaliphila]